MLVVKEQGFAYRPVPKNGTCSTHALIFQSLLRDNYYGPLNKQKYLRYLKKPMRYQAELKDILKINSIHYDRINSPTSNKKTKQDWDNILSELFVFSIVRNPWSRLVSAYKQAQKWYDPNMSQKEKDKLLEVERSRPHPEKRLSFDKMFKYMNKKPTFENFVNLVVNIEPDSVELANQHWRKQCEILRIGHFKYDYLGRFEQWDYSWEVIRHNTKLKFEKKTPKYNNHRKYDYKKFYKNKKIIDAVGDYYSEDIKELKYEW